MSGRRIATVERGINGAWTLRVYDLVALRIGPIPLGGLTTTSRAPLMEHRNVNNKDRQEWDRLLAEGGFRTNEDGWIGDGGLWDFRWPGWVAVIA